jgi:hypothetical protein
MFKSSAPQEIFNEGFTVILEGMLGQCFQEIMHVEPFWFQK